MRLSTRVSLSLSLVVLFAAGGCAEPTGDGENDDFVSPAGAADAFGVEEGSCDAQGALQVANSAGEMTLMDDVGLRSIAIRHLIEARADGPLETLTELDAVPWIGPVSFSLLLEYAEREGFVADCERGPATRTYVITLRAVAGGESFDESYGEWTYDDDAWDYVHQHEVTVETLPFRYSNGDLSASVSAEGELSLSYNVGDADASADASAHVPLDVAPGTQFRVELGGGDYASGSWNIEAELQLEVR
ncbi:MAG: hypothetical protein AB8I08_35720 [Sandaracinaceae bacterium]